MKHIFIDTNIFLNIFRSGCDGDVIFNELIKKIIEKKVKLYLTDRVVKEFYRNRDEEARRCLEDLERKKVKITLPPLARDVGGKFSDEIERKTKEINNVIEKIINQIADGIEKQDLHIDKFFLNLISLNPTIKTTSAIFDNANKRFLMGDPPRKNNNTSIGDAINWEILLKEVPTGNDLFLVTNDSDYKIKLNDKSLLKSFLSIEWRSKKKSKVFIYSTLSEFLKVEFGDKKITRDVIEREKLLNKNIILTIKVPPHLGKSSISKISEILDSRNGGNVDVYLDINGTKIRTSYSIEFDYSLIGQISRMGCEGKLS